MANNHLMPSLGGPFSHALRRGPSTIRYSVRSSVSEAPVGSQMQNLKLVKSPARAEAEQIRRALVFAENSVHPTKAYFVSWMARILSLKNAWSRKP